MNQDGRKHRVAQRIDAGDDPRLAPPPDPRLWIRIAGDLRQAIAAGQLAPGEPVTIFPLSERWGTCRQTVAKALSTLEREGLLARYPGHGYIVPRHPRETKDPVMTEEETATAEAIAQQIIEQLKPVLDEMNQKLDAISQMVDEVLDALSRLERVPRPRT
jgi:DNA-binding GntR family transcriptional regulator